ncbi:hypothetical protein PR048_007049 [Dryococelus australis]|uniref:Uncharacterized protein n=1 Tax=Dryococelus australis TaxID=614101 RepID=A0ABQ9IET0_9NEOP|nr:hypothetical protein PR048_007049 [Dryococelus australis]
MFLQAKSWLNDFMFQMKCCGVDNGEDFNESPWGKSSERGSKKVPEACCILVGDMSKFTPKDPQCPVNPTESNSYYSKVMYNLKSVDSEKNDCGY